MTKRRQSDRHRERMLVDEIDYLLENAARELEQKVVHVAGVDRRLVTCECLFRQVTATLETKPLEARMHMLRERLDDYLEPIVEEVAQSWMRHMEAHPLCKLDGPRLRLLKNRGSN